MYVAVDPVVGLGDTCGFLLFYFNLGVYMLAGRRRRRNIYIYAIHRVSSLLHTEEKHRRYLVCGRKDNDEPVAEVLSLRSGKVQFTWSQ